MLYINNSHRSVAPFRLSNLRNPNIAAMASLLCRLQILVGLEFGQSIPTVVHTVRELQLCTKGIKWSHYSTMSSYSALSGIWCTPRSYIEMKTKNVHLKIKDEIKYVLCFYNPLWLEVKYSTKIKNFLPSRMSCHLDFTNILHVF